MTTGVLLCAYGGPDSLDAVGPFMKNLMGVDPSPELLARVQRRYLAIGGSSPLTGIAMEIATGIRDALEERQVAMPVAVGMAYWNPFIVDALRSLKEQGCDRVIAMSLSPFESKVAHGTYRKAISAACEEIGGIEIIEAPLVSELDEFADFFAGATAGALQDLQPNQGAILTFTAHSLPESDMVENDPYVAGLLATADAVATRLGLEAGADDAGDGMFPTFRAYGSAAPPRAWYLTYQSKGNRPGAWLEPDIDGLIDAAAAHPEITAVIAIPIGFMTDHMETMYDLDIVAAGRALDADLEFVRVPVPNQDEMLIDAIAMMLVGLA